MNGWEKIRVNSEIASSVREFSLQHGDLEFAIFRNLPDQQPC